MESVIIHTASIEIALDTGIDIRDITGDLQRIVSGSRIRNGVAHVSVIGSTGSVTTIEYEPGVVEDLKRAISELAPPGADYAHEKAWHDGNGHSHVQAALLGPSISIPVRQGKLRLGTWQQAVVINHDNRARKRPLEITVTGTAS